ncbi:MAG: hypothetical protein ACJAX4_003272 [Clostridium sp.]|jgi:hypothetical protein
MSSKLWEWGEKMLQCPFLTTTEEEVECFKECSLYRWADNGGNCPFLELKVFKPLIIKNHSDYDLFSKDKSSPLRLLYKDTYS